MKTLTKDEIRGKYQKFALSYDQWEGIGEWLIIGRLRKNLLREARGKVLEIGIGTGKNLKYYQHSCTITGVDYSPAMLAIAEKRAKTLQLNVNLEVIDAEHLPFKRASFDTLVDTLGLCTYPDPVQALREMKRVCKKNGTILLLEHGLSSNWLLCKIQKRFKNKQLEKLGCHVDRDIQMLIHKAGLNLVNCYRYFFGVFYCIRAKT